MESNSPADNVLRAQTKAHVSKLLDSSITADQKLTAPNALQELATDKSSPYNLASHLCVCLFGLYCYCVIVKTPSLKQLPMAPIK